MDINKKYELQLKKNDDLQRQIYELQLENDQLRADADRQSMIMEDLEELRTEWMEEIEETKKVRKEYEILIAQLRVLRGKMKVE